MLHSTRSLSLKGSIYQFSHNLSMQPQVTRPLPVLPLYAPLTRTGNWLIRTLAPPPYIEPEGPVTGGLIAGVTIPSILVALLVFSWFIRVESKPRRNVWRRRYWSHWQRSCLWKPLKISQHRISTGCFKNWYWRKWTFRQRWNKRVRRRRWRCEYDC